MADQPAQDVRNKSVTDAAHQNNKYAPFAPIDPSTTNVPLTEAFPADDPFRGNDNNRRAFERLQNNTTGASVRGTVERTQFVHAPHDAVVGELDHAESPDAGKSAAFALQPAKDVTGPDSQAGADAPKVDKVDPFAKPAPATAPAPDSAPASATPGAAVPQPDTTGR